jgi:hypothetical protein
MPFLMSFTKHLEHVSS